MSCDFRQQLPTRVEHVVNWLRAGLGGRPRRKSAHSRPFKVTGLSHSRAASSFQNFFSRWCPEVKYVLVQNVGWSIDKRVEVLLLESLFRSKTPKLFCVVLLFPWTKHWHFVLSATSFNSFQQTHPQKILTWNVKTSYNSHKAQTEKKRDKTSDLKNYVFFSFLVYLKRAGRWICDGCSKALCAATLLVVAIT